MILNFTVLKHVSLIKAGIKIHSMREDIHNRWKVGMGIQFSTGQRTKHYSKFMDGECLGLQKVQMYQGSVGILVLIDGKMIDWKETLLLARNDGFPTAEAMMRFFVPKIPADPSEMNEWYGKIIHWTNKKY